MAFKDFLGGVFKKESKEEDNFLALILTPEKVLAAVWTFEEESIHVLGFSKKSYQNIQNIIHQAAVAIDNAAEKAKSDVTKVVFGLSQNWFEKKEPTKETAKILKKLSEDLDLSAQAFVPLSASIKNFLKIKESVTPHTVLVGIFEELVEVHLVKDNEVKKTVTSTEKPTMGKITNLLQELKENYDLPARVVVFGINEDSKLAEEIAKAEFKNIFHDLPKISFLKDSEVAKSVAFAQAADLLGQEPSITPATVASSNLISDQTKESKPQANELGFIEGEDILKVQDRQSQASREDYNNEDLAVQIENDLQKAKPIVAGNTEVEVKKEGIIEQIATLRWFAKVQNFFKGPGGTRKSATGLVVIVLLAVIGLYVGGRTLTNAEVVIKVNSKSQEDTFDVDVKKGGSSNFSKDQIAGVEISAKSGDSRKAVATGTKEVGEPAKGEVVVLNWTDEETSFSQGAVIITKNGIKFELDEGIKVASRAAKGPGEKNVKVTAIDLGSEGNIGIGSEFTFTQHDKLSYSAINDNAFTGGDEKEITVVSQEDLDKLKESLFESLKNAATTNLKEKAADKSISENAIEVEITKQIFDKDLEEEATLVTLELEVEAFSVAYDENSLKEYLAEISNEDAPENLKARVEGIETFSVNAKTFGGTLNLTGKYKVNFVPKFEDDDLKEQIAGKSVKEAREIIKNIPEVSDVNVNFSPAFFISNTLPSDKDKIRFKIES